LYEKNNRNSYFKLIHLKQKIMAIVVKTKNEDRFKVTVVLPSVGKVTPNHEGEFEHEDEDAARELVALNSDFFIKGEEPEEDELNKTEGDDLNNKGESGDELGLKPEVVQLSPEDKTELLETLPLQTRKGLEDLCASFPSKEWRGKNKEQLIEYLTGKL
jgi:hypothetical protein